MRVFWYVYVRDQFETFNTVLNLSGPSGNCPDSSKYLSWAVGWSSLSVVASDNKLG